MKKTMLIFFTAFMVMFLSCESPTSSQSVKSADTTKKSHWSDKLANWDKGSSAELKLENLVGTWLRKNNTTTPPSKIELLIESNKNITKKAFQNGSLMTTYTGTLSIKNTNEVVLNLEKAFIENKPPISNLGMKETYQSKLYQKYWECKEKKSGAWKSTEPFYKIK